MLGTGHWALGTRHSAQWARWAHCALGTDHWELGTGHIRHTGHCALPHQPSPHQFSPQLHLTNPHLINTRQGGGEAES